MAVFFFPGSLHLRRPNGNRSTDIHKTGLLSGFDNKRFDSVLATIQTAKSTQANYANNELPQSARVPYHFLPIS